MTLVQEAGGCAFKARSTGHVLPMSAVESAKQKEIVGATAMSDEVDEDAGKCFVCGKPSGSGVVCGSCE